MTPLLAAMAALAHGPVEAPTLTLRGGEPAPAGLVVGAASPAGVYLVPVDLSARAQASDAKIVVGWDRVAGLENAPAPIAAAAADAGEVRATLWRARTRLERGDWPAAEPIFEKLFPAARGQPGPTPAVIAEGLLRCRLRRGAHVQAVEPMLALLRAQAEGTATWLAPDWASAAGLGPVVDASLTLVPSLPPMWAPLPALETLVRDTAWATGWGETPGKGPSRTAQLASLYLEAARADVGLPASVPAITAADQGVQLVEAIVRARVGNAEQRAAARRVLQERLTSIESAAAGGAGTAGAEEAPGTPAWVEAWLRAGLGRSLTRESAEDQRLAGVVQLLHLPARFARSHPYLAGLALAEASATMKELGDERGAGVLARELASTFPTHPALDWEPLRAARFAEPARAAPGAAGGAGDAATGGP